MALNARQVKFAQNLAAGMSQTDAYISAGYSEKGADGAASKLANNPAVASYCKELQSKAAEQVVELTAEQRVTYDRVTALLDEMVNVSIADYMRDGSFIPTEEWTPAMRAAGVAFKVRRIKKRGQSDKCDHCGEDVPKEEYVFEISLPKKDRLVQLMGELRHVGAFSTIVQHQSGGDLEDFIAERERRNADRC